MTPLGARVCWKQPARQVNIVLEEFAGWRVFRVEDNQRHFRSDGALLTTFPGDTMIATCADVKAFAKGGSARIQR